MRPIVLALLITAGRGLAGTPDLNATPATPADLTLGNFFSEGWNQPWSLRESLPDGAPDLLLFHAPTNFLARASRTDFSYQDNLGKNPTKDVAYLDEYLDYAVNQRFMVSVFGNYTWLNRRTTPDLDGAGGGMIGRFELVNTPTASDCLNLRVDLPNKDINVHTTALSAAIAGWQDLTPMGPKGVGLYYDLQESIDAGLHTPGASKNALSYDVSVAKTWTKPSAPLGYLTTFAEFSGSTNMDGNQRMVTGFTATPGVQFIVGGHNLIMLGVDLPVTHPAADREVYRISYIYCF